MELRPKNKKTHLFGHLIPYNPGLRIFSEKQSCSNNGPYCPLQPCNNLGRSLELFWSKGKRTKITPEIKNFSNNLLRQWALLSSTIIPKIGKMLRAVLEKWPRNITRTDGRTTIFQHLIPYNPGLKIFLKNRFGQFCDFIILDYPEKIR